MPEPSCGMVYQCSQSLMFFGKRMVIVFDIERSNILTLSLTTALENVPLTSICSYTYQL